MIRAKPRHPHPGIPKRHWDYVWKLWELKRVFAPYNMLAFVDRIEDYIWEESDTDGEIHSSEPEPSKSSESESGFATPPCTVRVYS